jgi:hypothetical protein
VERKLFQFIGDPDAFVDLFELEFEEVLVEFRAKG